MIATRTAETRTAETRTGAPRFDPRPEPERRARPVAAPIPPPRHLRLVDPAQARRRRVTRALTGLLVAAVCAGLFAIVAMRVVLAQGQGQIDRLQSQVDSQTADQQRLRLGVAELEAPARIVGAARTRLGMVTPSTVVYLNPPPAQGR
jgi:cell division protein FtsL